MCFWQLQFLPESLFTILPKNNLHLYQVCTIERLSWPPQINNKHLNYSHCDRSSVMWGMSSCSSFSRLSVTRLLLMWSVWQEMLSFVRLLTRSQSGGDSSGAFLSSWEDKCFLPQCCAAPITDIITQSLFAGEDLLQCCFWSMSAHEDPQPPHRYLLYTYLSLSAHLFLTAKFLSPVFLCTAHIYRIVSFFKEC